MQHSQGGAKYFSTVIYYNDDNSHGAFFLILHKEKDEPWLILPSNIVQNDRG